LRNIKFRAWDKESGLMLNIPIVDFGDGTCYPYLHAKPLDFWNDVVLMQSTELKDNNGSDIYEGDILEDEDGFYVARFDAKRSSFVFDVYGVSGMMLESGWDETAGEFKKIETLPFDDLYDIPKVIGNIYENSELINR